MHSAYTSIQTMTESTMLNLLGHVNSYIQNYPNEGAIVYPQNMIENSYPAILSPSFEPSVNIAEYSDAPGLISAKFC
jgi:hypothetical protein